MTTMREEERRMRIEDVLVMHLKRKREGSGCKRGSEEGFQRIEAQLREAKRMRQEESRRNSVPNVSLMTCQPARSTSSSSSSSSSSSLSSLTPMVNLHQQRKVFLAASERTQRIHQQHYQLRLRQLRLLAQLHDQRKGGLVHQTGTTQGSLRPTSADQRIQFTLLTSDSSLRPCAHQPYHTHHPLHRHHRHGCPHHQRVVGLQRPKTTGFVHHCQPKRKRSALDLTTESTIATSSSLSSPSSLPSSNASALPSPSSLLLLSYPLASLGEPLNCAGANLPTIDRLPARFASSDVRLPPLLALLEN